MCHYGCSEQNSRTVLFALKINASTQVHNSQTEMKVSSSVFRVCYVYTYCIHKHHLFVYVLYFVPAFITMTHVHLYLLSPEIQIADYLTLETTFKLFHKAMGQRLCVLTH